VIIGTLTAARAVARPAQENGPLARHAFHFYYISSENISEDVMTEVDLAARGGQPMESAGPTARPPLTLAEEHVLLLWQVTASAEKLLTAAEYGRWPGAELAALAGYAQAEVLRQVADEEALLFPAVPARMVAGLARDHVRLRAAAELLARAAAGEQPMSPAQVAAAVRDFVVRLERHLRNEEDLLASGRAPQDVPGTVHLGGHPHEWYPLTEGPVVDLDALPPDQAVAAAVDRLLPVRLDQSLHSAAGTPPREPPASRAASRRYTRPRQSPLPSPQHWLL
jgi:hypothetical protein